jgi:hypothetical protein
MVSKEWQELAVSRPSEPPPDGFFLDGSGCPQPVADIEGECLIGWRQAIYSLGNYADL